MNLQRSGRQGLHRADALRQDAVGLRHEEPCVAAGCRICRRRSRSLEARPAYKKYLTYGKPLDDAGGQEWQAPGESLRSGRNTRGADGAAHGRRQAGATIDRAASPAVKLKQTWTHDAAFGASAKTEPDLTRQARPQCRSVSKALICAHVFSRMSSPRCQSRYQSIVHSRVASIFSCGFHPSSSAGFARIERQRCVSCKLPASSRTHEAPSPHISASFVAMRSTGHASS